jgi:uncharacterized membrane protein SpoIIM required for sporulation
MYEPPAAPSPEPAAEKSPMDDLLNGRRLLLIFAILIVELVIFGFGLLTPLSQATQQALANQTNNQFGFVKTATPPQLVVFIFAHNLPIALAEMIPVLGAGLFGLSIYGTGLAAQAIVVAQGHSAIDGIILLFFPYSLVELSSYAIAVGGGIMLIVALIRERFRRELKVFMLEAVVITMFLLVAAIMETVTGLSPAIGFALWLPTGLALAGIILAAGRRKN